jgi:hypothetical protein
MPREQGTTGKRLRIFSFAWVDRLCFPVQKGFQWFGNPQFKEIMPFAGFFVANRRFSAGKTVIGSFSGA